MANSTSGKWVSRVGSQGGGKTYRKSRPVNYYGAIFVIVVLGLALMIYSRYEYQNPVKKHMTAIAPKIGSLLYAGISFQACGNTLADLPTDDTNTSGFLLLPNNVISLHPTTVTDAGLNATVKQFGAEYNGLILTSSEMALPTAKGSLDPATTFKNGDSCAAGTPDAGKTGKIIYAYWTSLSQKKPVTTTNPALIHFSKELRISVGFEPKGVIPKAPPAKTTDDMFELAQAQTTTTVAGTATTTTTLKTTITSSVSSTTTTNATTTTTAG